jgi:Mrp family chromosome partitioning ATPase
VVDGVLLVTQANRTSKRDVGEGLARLDRVGARLVGVVLNRAQPGGREAGYGYGYGYGYGGRQSQNGQEAEPAKEPLPPPWAPPQGSAEPAKKEPLPPPWVPPQGSTTTSQPR